MQAGQIITDMTLGLPPAIQACLFDLDGVLTQTASVHAAAWKQMFDEFLRMRAEQTGQPFVPFDPVQDYAEYVDGKPRYDGVRSFLSARDIQLPEGSPDDQPAAETVHGLGNRKNELVLELIRRNGVMTYEGSVHYVRAVRDAQLHRAVVSSSATTGPRRNACRARQSRRARRRRGASRSGRARTRSGDRDAVSRRRARATSARAQPSTRRRSPCRDSVPTARSGTASG